ncbi:MAG: ComEC/Rec2 family competence protein [Lachnospiraceae bacterium]
MKKIAPLLLIMCFVGVLFTISMEIGADFKTFFTAKEDLRVVFIKTQNDADCTLLIQQNNAVLIDAGEEVDAEHILNVLKKEGVEKLDYIILTHNDKDHIGGVKYIVQNISTQMVVQSYIGRTTDLSIDLESYLESQKITVYKPTNVKKIYVSQMQIVVYPPLEKQYKDDNNTSLAVFVQHNKVKMFFAGDCLRKRSEELMKFNIKNVDLYHVAHHGRANRASDELFLSLAPKFAIVTAKQADEIIIESAEICNSKILYTLDQEYQFISDGSMLNLIGVNQ